MKKISFFLSFLAILIFSNIVIEKSIVADGHQNKNDADVELGQLLAKSCYSCHGPQGKSVGYIPSLTGLSGEAIEQKMKAFKEDNVMNTIMGRLAKGYTDEEIKAVSAYFSIKKL